MKSSFTVASMWRTSEGRPVMDAECTYTFYNQQADCRYVDISLTFKASYGSVIFEKQKKRGLFWRPSCRSACGDRGGYIENSYGARGEAECWEEALTFAYAAAKPTATCLE